MCIFILLSELPFPSSSSSLLSILQPLSPFSVPLFLLILSLPSQFHRSLPGPPDLTPAEVSSLVQRYRDPSSGLYNYMQFHNDIERLGREEEGGGSGPPQPLSMPVRMIPRLFLFNHDLPPVYIHNYHLVIMHQLHNHVYFVMSVAQYNSRHKFQVAFMYVLTYCIAPNPVVHKFLSFFTETTRCKSG